MTEESTLEINWSAWDRTVKGYQRTIQLTAFEMQAQLAFEAPRDTGRLAGSFGVAQLGEFSWQAGTNVEYSIEVMWKKSRNVGASGQPPIGSPTNFYQDRAIDNVEKKMNAIIKQAQGEARVPH